MFYLKRFNMSFTESRLAHLKSKPKHFTYETNLLEKSVSNQIAKEVGKADRLPVFFLLF